MQCRCRDVLCYFLVTLHCYTPSSLFALIPADSGVTSDHQWLLKKVDATRKRSSTAVLLVDLTGIFRVRWTLVQPHGD